MLKVLILGSAAGGGSPQWNCNSSVSRAVREGNRAHLQEHNHLLLLLQMMKNGFYLMHHLILVHKFLRINKCTQKKI